MNFDEWKIDCPLRAKMHPRGDFVCGINDHTIVRSCGKDQRVGHSTIFGECCEKNCKEYNEVWGKDRRVY